MTFLDRWCLRRIFKKEVRQGNHKCRVCILYSMIREAVKDEFPEDNEPTIDAFLDHVFRATQYENNIPSLIDK